MSVWMPSRFPNAASVMVSWLQKLMSSLRTPRRCKKSMSVMVLLKRMLAVRAWGKQARQSARRPRMRDFSYSSSKSSHGCSATASRHVRLVARRPSTSSCHRYDRMERSDKYGMASTSSRSDRRGRRSARAASGPAAAMAARRTSARTATAASLARCTARAAARAAWAGVGAESMALAAFVDGLLTSDHVDFSTSDFSRYLIDRVERPVACWAEEAQHLCDGLLRRHVERPHPCASLSALRRSERGRGRLPLARGGVPGA